VNCWRLTPSLQADTRPLYLAAPMYHNPHYHGDMPDGSVGDLRIGSTFIVSRARSPRRMWSLTVVRRPGTFPARPEPPSSSTPNCSRR